MAEAPCRIGGRAELFQFFGGVTVRLKDGIEEYTHNDHQGSPVAATDSMGNVAWREAYTPFGEKWQSAPANDNDIGPLPRPSPA